MTYTTKLAVMVNGESFKGKAMTVERPTVGILVGGGPAPGINSVISAATIRSILGGSDVLGIIDGFKWLMEGGTGQVRPLSIEDVSRIHFRGGSCLGTSRANPTRCSEHLDNVLSSLSRLGVARLITIGGDDTVFSAMKLEERAGGRLQVVHVPKTIDNDLDLPHGVPTFGFQTARHIGVEIVKNLMVDARTTAHWYVVVTMGRKAGHLALGIGKAAGATLTMIPEEFQERPVRFQRVVDLVIGTMIKRLDQGRPHGVVVLAEGLIEILDPRDIGGMEHVERDAHGHLRLNDVDIGDLLRRELSRQLRHLGISAGLIAKNVGYELRCADPIPYDIDYTRDLGYCAAQYLLDGGSAVMVSMQNGRFTPIPFKQMIDSTTERTRVRMVDIESQTYHIARQYMIRLTEDDMNSGDAVGRYAALAGLSEEAFRARFRTVV